MGCVEGVAAAQEVEHRRRQADAGQCCVAAGADGKPALLGAFMHFGRHFIVVDQRADQRRQFQLEVREGMAERRQRVERLDADAMPLAQQFVCRFAFGGHRQAP